jgi:hypothetical protein
LDYRSGRKLFGELSLKERRGIISQFLAEMKPPAWMVPTIGQLQQSSRGAHHKPFSFGKTLLLTYNGSWGVHDTWRDASRFPTLGSFVDHIRAEPFAARLWEEFVEYAKNLMKDLQCSDYAASAEVCTETYQDRKEGRLHLHLWLRSQSRIVFSCQSQLRFMHCFGVPAHTIGGQPTNARQAGFTGALYLSPYKIGSVFSASNRRMFSDYIIQPAWVMNLLQCNKITRESARSLIVQASQNVAKYLHDLDTLELEEQKMATAALSQQVLGALTHLARPFHCLDEVEAWKRQYEEHAFRFKFLVLEGPSRIGKTVFARMTLTPAGKEFYELNCAGDAELDLRGVQPHKHGLVIFDEISPVQVLRQKKVFQAGPTEIQLGQSSTSVYGYSKWFYKMRMVCCSNVWTSVMRALPKDDADWLEKNSVHILRHQPLFMEEG